MLQPTCSSPGGPGPQRPLRRHSSQHPGSPSGEDLLASWTERVMLAEVSRGAGVSLREHVGYWKFGRQTLQFASETHHSEICPLVASPMRLKLIVGETLFLPGSRKGIIQAQENGKQGPRIAISPESRAGSCSLLEPYWPSPAYCVYRNVRMFYTRAPFSRDC